MGVSSLFVGMVQLTAAPYPSSVLQVTTAGEAYFEGLEERSQAVRSDRSRWILESGHTVVFSRGKLSVSNESGDTTPPIDISRLLREYPEGEVWVSAVPEEEGAVEVFVGEKDDRQGFLLVAELPKQKSASEEFIWYGSQLVVTDGTVSPYDAGSSNYQAGRTVSLAGGSGAVGKYGLNSVRIHAHLGMAIVPNTISIGSSGFATSFDTGYAGGIRPAVGGGVVFDYELWGARLNLDYRSVAVGGGLRYVGLEYLNFLGQSGLQVTGRYRGYVFGRSWIDAEVSLGFDLGAIKVFGNVVTGSFSYGFWGIETKGYRMLVSAFSTFRYWGFGSESVFPIFEASVGVRFSVGRGVSF